jgi:HSP20 family protein
VDIHEAEDALVVKMELAGAKADDLHVSLAPDNRVLTVSGVRAESHTDREGRVRCHQLEIYFGPFERTILLPSGLILDRDGITASYHDGFLLVSLPKRPAPPEPQRRVIPITAGAVPTNSESEDK